MLELNDGKDMNEEMKKGFQSLLKNLINKGIDLETTPVVFKWSYEEDPFIQYQLLIIQKDQGELLLEEREEGEYIVH
jgi:hypothetical protein